MTLTLGPCVSGPGMPLDELEEELELDDELELEELELFEGVFLCLLPPQPVSVRLVKIKRRNGVRADKNIGVIINR